MPYFSIIVPVYNAAHTIGRCIDSVLSQSLDDYELIIINDGSNDQTEAICLQFNNDKIIYRRQENRGVSAARNRGLDLATGKWICFLDSDDSLEPDYLAEVSERTEESEAVFLGYNLVDQERRILKRRLPKQEGSSLTEQCISLSRQDMFGYTWIKAFSAQAIGKNRFRQDISLFEDEIFACEVLKNCSRIAVLPHAIYNYTAPGDGALTNKTFQNYCGLNEAVYQAWIRFTGHSVLKEKAEQMTGRCICYGFERKIHVSSYFSDMSKCQFFLDADGNSLVSKSIQQKNMIFLRAARLLYRLRAGIGKKKQSIRRTRG